MMVMVMVMVVNVEEEEAEEEERMMGNPAPPPYAITGALCMISMQRLELLSLFLKVALPRGSPLMLRLYTVQVGQVWV